MNSELEKIAAFKRKTCLGKFFKNGSVLIADDAPNMRRSVKNMLRHLGIEDKHIIEANDGDSALEIIKDVDNKVLFVLLDWNMPHLAGIDVVKIIKEDETLKNILVLMITAESNMEQIAEAAELGADGYVVKPFLPKTIEEKMFNIINPPEFIKMIKKGEELLNQGKYDEALAVLEGVLKEKQDSASTRILIGKVYEAKKNNVMARQQYEEAIEKNPQYLRAHETFANFLVKIDDKEAALESLENAVKISPQNADRYLMIGKIAMESGKDKEKADQALKKAIKQDPKMTQKAAEIYLEGGELEKAEILFRASLDNNKSVHGYNRLGITLRKQRKWKKAIEEYLKAVALEPNDEVVYYNIGMAYLEGDREQDAIKYFEKALEIDPDFDEAKERMENLSTK